MKKTLLTLIMLAGLSFAQWLNAQEFSANSEGSELKFEVTDATNKEVSVVGSTSLNTEKLVIPARVTHEGVDYTVRVVGKDAFSFKQCKALELPSTLKQIEQGAFYYCTKLTGNLILPESLESIGKSAFYYCSGLTGNLTLPESLESIGELAFYYCGGFTGNLTLPESLESIGEQAFAHCVGFTGQLTLPTNLKSIADYAFYYCGGFTGQLILPESLESIGAHAFYHCVGFTGQLLLPESLESIGGSAFCNCTGLSGTLTIPSNMYIEDVGSMAFAYCSGINEIIFPDDWEEITYSFCEGMAGLTSLELPEYCKVIDRRAFYGCSGLTGTFVVGEYIEKIAEDAFSGTSYDRLRIEGNAASSDLRSDENVFGKSIRTVEVLSEELNLRIPSSVETVIWGDKIKKIGNYAFAYCNKLPSDCRVPRSVTRIESGAFMHCTSFTGTLVLHEGLEFVDYQAYAGCCDLGDTLRIEGTTWSNSYSNVDIFNGAEFKVLDIQGTALNIHIPSTVDEVLWGDRIEVIGDCAFVRWTKKLKGTFEIPSTVRAIGNSTFEDCRYLTGTFTIPANVEFIGENAFKGCTGIDTLRVEGSAKPDYDWDDALPIFTDTKIQVLDIGGSEYYLPVPSTVEEIIWGDQIEVIGNSAFANYTKLSSLSLPPTLRQIERCAFSACTNLKGTLTIPANVEFIGENAFKGCTGIDTLRVEGSARPDYDWDDALPVFTDTRITVLDIRCKEYGLPVPNTIETILWGEQLEVIGENTFLNFTNLKSIDFPNTLRVIKGNAFKGCTGLEGTLVIPELLDTIYPYAFDGCTGLDTLRLIGAPTTTYKSRGDADPIFENCNLKVLDICGKGIRIPAPSTVESILWGDKLEVIGPKTFYAHQALKGNLDLPNTVRIIGDQAFQKCPNLSDTLHIPTALDTLGREVFRECAGFNTLVMNGGPRSIGNYAFDGITFTDVHINSENLTIPIPKTVETITWGETPIKTIGDNMFLECTKITGEMNFPEGLMRIGDFAFYGCSGLTDLNLPSTLEYVGREAFNKCDGLSGDKLIIPSGVDSIGSCAFKTYYRWGEYSGMMYDTLQIDGIPSYVGQDAFGNSYWEDDSNPKWVMQKGQGDEGESDENTEERVPYGVLVINANEYKMPAPYSVKQVIWTDSLRHIGKNAFRGCGAWTGELILPEELVNIGDVAFYGCLNLSGTVVLPEGMEVIGESTFWGCDNLSGIMIPEGIDTIGNYALFNCGKLTEIELPSTLRYIGRDAFDGCRAVRKTIINSEEELQIDCPLMGDTLGLGKDVKNVKFATAQGQKVIEYNIARLGEAFTINEAHESVTQILIGDDVRTIPEGMFYEYSHVKEVTLPKGVEYVHPRAFHPNTILGGSATLPMHSEFTVLNGIVPENRDRFYDVDKDGLLDVVGDVTAKQISSYPDVYEHYLSIANNMGGVKKKVMFESSSDYVDALTIDDIDRDGNPEVLINDDDKDKWCFYDVTTNDMKQELSIGYSDYRIAFDANGDGRVDYYYYSNGSSYILYQQADGSFVRKEVEIITDANEISELAFAQYGANYVAPASIIFTGVSLARVARPSLQEAASADAPQRVEASPIFAKGGPCAIDINMDGLMDLLNLENGNALMSLGNGRYYYGKMNGEVTAKDLTGDGIPDFVVYNAETHKVTLQLYAGEGKFTEQQLYANEGISGIYCYDFDKDNDIDVLLTFDYNQSIDASFCAFFENEGEGSFRKRERVLEEKLYFADDLKDLDNDGYYELIAYEFRSVDNIDSIDFYTVKCTDNLQAEVSSVPFCKTKQYYDNHPTVFSADADNDGQQETWINGVGVDVYNEWNYMWTTNSGLQGRIFTDIKNTAPEKMNAPRALFDTENYLLRLEWDLGSDKEQSALDLTYAVRIGTESGQGDIVYAHADATGRRLRLGQGNAGFNTYKYFMASGWNVGTYYIAVQAIDQNDCGGPWSDELVFELEQQTAQFDTYRGHMTIIDTLSVNLSTPYNANFSYAWDFGEDATVVKNEQGTWWITYATIGNKTIELQITTDQGKVSEPYQSSLFVSAVKFTNLDTIVVEDDGDERNYHFERKGHYVDFNLDGTLDLLGSYKGHSTNSSTIYGVMSNQGDGCFKKYKGLYNNDLDACFDAVILDLNMDGYPDFLTNESGKPNRENVFVNNEDFDFDLQVKQLALTGFDDDWQYEQVENSFTQAFYNSTYRIDFNNDGLKDVWTKDKRIYLNQGDNFTFKSAVDYYSNILGNDDEDILAVRDMNNDGWVDLITTEYVNDYGHITYIRFNGGDMTFNEKVQIRVSDSRNYSSDINSQIVDLNNDGYLDIVATQEDSKCIEVLLGDAGYDYSNVAKISSFDDFLEIENYYFADYDNNGYLDLQVRYSDGQGILYLYEGWENMIVGYGEIGNMQQYNMSTSLFGDVTNDGVPDLTSYNLLSILENQRPAAPTGVRASQTQKGMRLAWEDAIDTETPKAQMRYNISLKKKGAKRENAYIISPLNDGKDYIPPMSEYNYLKGVTNYTVNYSRLEGGQEYELKVQAFDAWGAASAFSETYTFTMSDDIFVNGTDATCVGNGITLTVNGGSVDETSELTWDVGDGSIVSQEANSAEIIWDTPGLKEVSVTTNGKKGSMSIMVNSTLDLSFDLPNTVLSGGYTYFTLPEAFNDPMNKIKAYSSFDFEPVPVAPVINTNGFKTLTISRVPKAKLTLERRSNSLDARMYVNAVDGDYWVEFRAEDQNCGEIIYRQEFNVEGKNITPQISIVSVDAATGKNKITWDEPSDLNTQNGIYDKIIILKEIGATDNYESIAEVPISNGEFIDPSSDPYVRSGRYRIALGTIYGGVSNASETHASVHVMLNRGVVANSVNIVWTPYVGGTIDQYTILRGTSPSNMQVLTTASGYETSYTDMAVPQGDVYYALQYTNFYENEWNPISGPANAGMMRTGASTRTCTGVSNAVNANAAATTTLATSIRISHVQEKAELKPTQASLLLYTEILPSMASYKKANWRIIEGAHLATITQDGLLTYAGNGANGEVTVKATTLDGSNLSDVISIAVSEFVSDDVLVTRITIAPIAELTPDHPMAPLVATVSPVNATVQDVEWSVVSGVELITISADNQVESLGTGNGTAVIRATAQDGSDVYAEATVIVSGYGSGVEATDNDLVSVVAHEQKVLIRGAEGRGVSVFTIAGQLLHHTPRAQNEEVYALPSSGVYLVQVSTRTYKVVLN